MDRYDFEVHSQISTFHSFSRTSPILIDLEWISTINDILRYAYPIIILIGLFFSLLTLLALIQNVHMTSKSYLFTQTIFDILFLLLGICLIIPKHDSIAIPKFFNEKIYYNYLFYILWFIIIWLFLISCLDHTCTSIQSNAYNEKVFCSPCNSKTFIIGIILLGIIFSLPQLFAWESYETTYRSTDLQKSILYKHIYFWFLHIIYLFIPLFAIFVFMGTLLYTLCKKKEYYLLTFNDNHYGHYTIHHGNLHENSLHYSKTHERENITKLFVFMCLLHLIFVLPFSFVIFFGKLFLREQTTLIPKILFNEIILAYDLSLILFYIQILMKFFVLTIFSGNFRLSLKKMITCRCCCCCCRAASMDQNLHGPNHGIHMK